MLEIESLADGSDETEDVKNQTEESHIQDDEGKDCEVEDHSGEMRLY